MLGTRAPLLKWIELSWSSSCGWHKLGQDSVAVQRDPLVGWPGLLGITWQAFAVEGGPPGGLQRLQMEVHLHHTLPLAPPLTLFDNGDDDDDNNYYYVSIIVIVIIISNKIQ